MTTNNDGWIKMSDKQPLNAAPIWGAFEMDGEMVVSFYDRGIFPSIVTHWQPATIPTPPKKELTQREKDEEAFTKFFLNEASTKLLDSAVRHEAWHAALAYRDKQNAEDLSNVLFMPEGKTSVPHLEAVTNLRRRCGLDS
jgi:hypothetical protein